jgi:hypothetical protein
MRNDCSIAEQLKTQLTFTGTCNESIAFSLSSLVLSTLAAEMQKSKKKTAKTMHTTIPPVCAQIDTCKAQISPRASLPIA